MEIFRRRLEHKHGFLWNPPFSSLFSLRLASSGSETSELGAGGKRRREPGNLVNGVLTERAVRIRALGCLGEMDILVSVGEEEKKKSKKKDEAATMIERWAILVDTQGARAFLKPL